MKDYTFKSNGKVYEIRAENLTAALAELRRRIAAGQ